MFNDRSPFSDPSSGASSNAVNSRLAGTKFQFRRKLMRLIGASVYLYDPNEQLLLFVEQKGFKLKEDIRVYTDESKSQEIMRIAARKVLDFSGSYDVFESPSNAKLGVLRRKGLKSSFIRDEWLILDAQDREVGLIQEDSTILALMRRFVEYISLLVPQKYTMTVGGREVGTMSRVFNPFSSRIDVDFSADPNGMLDRRISLAAGVLLCVIEGKQR